MNTKFSPWTHKTGILEHVQREQHPTFSRVALRPAYSVKVARQFFRFAPDRLLAQEKLVFGKLSFLQSWVYSNFSSESFGSHAIESSVVGKLVQQTLKTYRCANFTVQRKNVYTLVASCIRMFKWTSSFLKLSRSFKTKDRDFDCKWEPCLWGRCRWSRDRRAGTQSTLYIDLSHVKLFLQTFTLSLP